MNDVIERILSHRSVRKFTDQRLTDEQIETIVRCSQAASTSSYIQAYTIIGVTDQEKKERLAEISGNQPYVAKNGHLFVFCADFHRHHLIGELENGDVEESLASTEKFMVAVIDAALAAQNAALAAESMGLGICYIGGLRNDLDRVCELLNVPKYVIPFFALVCGYPEKINEQKPRLPFSHIYHENEYPQDKTEYINQLKEYNEIVKDYYIRRTNGKRQDTWTEQIVKMLERKSRMYMNEFVQKQGFNKI